MCCWQFSLPFFFFPPLHSWNSEIVCRFCLVIVFHFFLDAWEGAKVVWNVEEKRDVSDVSK